MNNVTYSIRVDRHDPDIIWIDQLIDDDLAHTYGPFTGSCGWLATESNGGRADQAAFARQWELPVPQGWEAV